MKLGKLLQKFIDFSLNKLICIKDVTDPEYMKYNSFSIYMGLLFVATLTATITTAIQGQYTFLPFIIGLTIVAFFSGHDVRRKRIPMKQLEMIVMCVEILSTVICPILYVTSGGIHSATTIWFFLVINLTFIMLEGKKKWTFLTLQIVLYVGAIVMDGLGFVHISGEMAEGSWYFGTIVALVVVSFSIGGYIHFQLSEYRRQQQNLIMEIKEVSAKKSKTDELMKLVETQRDIAQKALKTQGEFLSNMNNEIRNPLNAIIGISEVISRIDDVDQIHDLIGNITGAAKGLNVMLGDILEYSETGENALEIHPEPYNTDIIFNSFRNMFVPSMEQKGLKFELEREKIPKVLIGDVTRTQQVLFHITNNAIKYTDKGKIVFSVSYDYDRQTLQMSIKDTGIGIKEEDIPDIFDQFKRLENANHRRTEGTGLGLALSKKIIEKMGGSIFVESVYGEGSLFTIRVPQAEVRKVPKESEQPVQTEIKYDFQGKKVMYVDNTQANHLIMDSMLLETGAFIGHEYSPKDLLDYSQDKLKSYDMFIIDYVLPVMDGAELLAHLRSRGVKAPAICASDELTEDNIMIFKRKGFNYFVSKPLKKSEVHKKLSEIWQ